MNAEVIAIGDELTTGQRLDTNSQWLAEQLTQLGFEVVYHTTVADDLAANVRVFRSAAARADVAVVTGGLGPTQDDLTRESLAEVLGCPLVLDEASLRHIEAIFTSRGRKMPERNRLQAMFPEGTQPIPNPSGTAPGIVAHVPRSDGGRCRVYALPGVPAEMKQMYFETVAPELVSGGAGRVFRHRRIKCFGLGESQVEAKLPDLIRRGREPRVGITASGATITLRITASGEDEAACLAAIEPTADTIYNTLGHLIFGEESDELQHVVLRMLAERGDSLATAEMSSNGLVAQWLREADPSGQQYRGGVVLPVGADHVPIELARNARRQFGADVGLSVGPAVAEGDTGKATPPAFGIAIVASGAELSEWASLVGHPSIQSTRNAKMALNGLRLALLRGQL